MREWLRNRYLDLLGSIYMYNEHRGYTAIDRVLDAVRARWPEDIALIEKIERHRADERKHYLMFRRWFERRGVMPIAVDRTCGHIDRFVGIMFRSKIDDLDPRLFVDRDDLFERLCRVVSLTEQRGYRQVEDPAAPSCRPVRCDAYEDFSHHRAGRAEPLGALR